MKSRSPSMDLLGAASPSLAGLLDLGCRGAATDAPVLILGESGTGRTTLARALHGVSGRRRGPLVEVDPGTVPSTLFESEFFGHMVGAFTGAESSTEGRVTRAEGGSLLLDHVEETPVAAQAKLLRLLAEQRYAPLGGRDRVADVRFLAIGPDDLGQRVDSGTFRPDLYYRLEVVKLRLPPMRERMSDLPFLLDHFLSDLGERFARDRLELAAGARAWMESYPWPGNLRQLRNVLEREVVVSRKSVLDPPPPRDSSAVPLSLAEMEKEQIVRALRFTRGHQGRAAEILGISRKSLWERRRRLGLP